MKRFKTAIVGAGAAGLMAACRLGAGTVLLDGNQKPGKKLLATGNGRCNLTNLNISPEHYHGDTSAAELLTRYPAGKIMAEFEKLGLLCRSDSEGRVYPNSLQAAAVLQLLRGACERAGVACELDFEVKRISRRNGGFLLTAADGRELFAERCILACGGNASPKHSRGSGYELARSLGHSVTALSPSLAPLTSSAKSCRALKGMRCKARAALINNGKEIYSESGEVIFGDGQLSGICIFNLSAKMRGLSGKTEVSLDLAEDVSVDRLVKYLRGVQRLCPQMPASELFSGVINLRVGQELVKIAGIDRNRSCASLTAEEIEKAAAVCKSWRFSITGTGDWNSAQVTAGGVPLSEIDIRTMESEKCAGLYLVGELLNVDGDCGGYNLHWAWATALAAAAAQKSN